MQKADVYVLEVVITTGSLGTWRPIAAAASEKLLLDALPLWLAKNGDLYGGNYRVTTIPFLLPDSS